MAGELKHAHQGRIPVVCPHPKNNKAKDLASERYLFQWDTSPDGRSGAQEIAGMEDDLRLLLPSTSSQEVIIDAQA